MISICGDNRLQQGLGGEMYPTCFATKCKQLQKLSIEKHTAGERPLTIVSGAKKSEDVG